MSAISNLVNVSLPIVIVAPVDPEMSVTVNQPFDLEFSIADKISKKVISDVSWIVRIIENSNY